MSAQEDFRAMVLAMCQGADQRRSENHNILISGEISGENPEEFLLREMAYYQKLHREEWGRVCPLTPIDMFAFWDKSMHLPMAVKVRLDQYAHMVGYGTTASSRHVWQARFPNDLETASNRANNSLALGYGYEYDKTVDPETYVYDMQAVSLAAHDAVPAFKNYVDALVHDYTQLARTRGTPVFVQAITNVAAGMQHIVEMLFCIQKFTHPNLIYVVEGSESFLQQCINRDGRNLSLDKFIPLSQRIRL